MINNVMMVSGVQQSDLVIHIYIYMYLFKNFFPFNLLHNIEQHSLRYTVVPC